MSEMHKYRNLCTNLASKRVVRKKNKKKILKWSTEIKLCLFPCSYSNAEQWSHNGRDQSQPVTPVGYISPDRTVLEAELGTGLWATDWDFTDSVLPKIDEKGKKKKMILKKKTKHKCCCEVTKKKKNLVSMLLVFEKKKEGVFDWMYILWTSIFLVNVHYAANVHGNAAGPLPVSLSSFLISSICISFSHRCHIWSSRRCMRSTRSTAV